MKGLLTTCAGLILFCSTDSGAQTITRQQAVQSALSAGKRLAVAAADTSVARARLLTASALPNPSLSATYSKSAPQLHIAADLPLELPGVRSARINSAQAFVRSAEYRFRFERAAIALAADTSFTRAAAAAARARLSQRNAYVADTLVQMTIARRNAGDASELEVEMTRVNAGQQNNLAVADSTELAGALFDLQVTMGLNAPSSAIRLQDSLFLPDTIPAAPVVGKPLQLAAAEAAVASAGSAVFVQRRGALGTPGIVAGFETRDPGGSENRILPTFGFTIPLPLFNRNQSGIATARADLRRAEADLALVRVEYYASVARAQRERSTAYARAVRDSELVAIANRVAEMSVTAYRAGAMSLPNVFEARRNARDILRQYIDDLAATWIADAGLRLLLLTTGQP